jgi:Cu/Zn superoxide dismutase|uniref:Superoxide dismutase copper/zinc binding domain-containing protein n=1 Tax=viral metagenome TaxID=1070528 RepID=A0A6C0KQW5_9ZZZZ
MVQQLNAIAVFSPKCSPISGYVKFHQCNTHQNALVQFSLKGLPSNSVLGCHIHKYGITSLTDPCGSTCDHYNPFNTLHGSQKLYGNDRHAGDLINNIQSDSNGEFNFSYEDPLLFNIKDILGRSVVIHSGIDDLGINRTFDKGSATTGNAGGRIACSVIGLNGGACV